jgi:hypothetical protein
MDFITTGRTGAMRKIAKINKKLITVFSIVKGTANFYGTKIPARIRGTSPFPLGFSH